MAKSDWVLGALALIATSVSVYVYFSKGNTFSQVEMLEELQVVAVIRESDCVTCIEKTLCYWERIQADFASRGVLTRLIFCKESDGFDPVELEHLCQVPKSFEMVNLSAMRSSMMPLSTPAILVTDGRQELVVEPIFLSTDMQAVRHKLIAVMEQYLPQVW